jgi:hypothetical protein
MENGLWVIITTTSGARVLGQIAALNFNKELPSIDPSDVLAAEVVTLMPAFDFFAPLRPVPVTGPNGQQQMAMARDPIVTGRDFALKPYPVHITVGGNMQFDFIHEMEPTDQRTYRNFIESAQQATDAESARKAGVILPTGPRVHA